MSQLRNKTDAQQAHIRSLWIFILILVSIVAFTIHGWYRAPESIRVHVPPDLRSGATMDLNEVPPANLYAFSHYIFQQLNHWPNNGKDDFGKNIFRLSAFFTPRFRADLIEEMNLKGRRGELANRVRTVQIAPGHAYSEERVVPMGAGAWMVTLDYALKETVRGMEVKAPMIRYPLRVVRYDVDPEINPWGLAIDGYAKTPARMTDEELVTSSEAKLKSGGS